MAHGEGVWDQGPSVGACTRGQTAAQNEGGFGSISDQPEESRAGARETSVAQVRDDGGQPRWSLK